MAWPVYGIPISPDKSNSSNFFYATVESVLPYGSGCFEVKVEGSSEDDLRDNLKSRSMCFC